MLGIGRRLVCAISLALLAGSTAVAHPGHGRAGGDFSALHYLGEPDHLVFAVLLLVLVALLGTRAVRSRRRESA